ncbi:MAG TPA: GntR family transcriptional regulator [Terrimesophilobacter sp.]|nr:GntR family transcriptional regulator [Terrimesophilobacter sp.]
MAEVAEARVVSVEVMDRISTSPVVVKIFNAILDDINQGRLLPGDRISDLDLADAFTVSRTPVREAIQRLREIGLIEASASRFTRVAIVSPQQTAEGLAVWLALFAEVLRETVPGADAAFVAELEAAHGKFKAAVEARDMRRIATTNFEFVQLFTARSRNAVLRRSVRAVVHLVQLGSLHLPTAINFDQLADAQRLLIDAARSHDVSLGQSALDRIRAIELTRLG